MWIINCLDVARAACAPGGVMDGVEGQASLERAAWGVLVLTGCVDMPRS